MYFSSDCEFMDSNLAAATDWPTFSAVSLISNYRQTDTWIGVYRNEKVSDILAGLFCGV